MQVRVLDHALSICNVCNRRLFSFPKIVTEYYIIGNYCVYYIIGNYSIDKQHGQRNIHRAIN